ncbi:hypothetical protein M3Y97_00765400 [Aphelenchoides bicaudatus]|nr:hypothetical protein M3Y97_00765400 [Aphelenchoides bicaudatus]
MSLPISSIFASLRIGPSCGMIVALTPEICQIRGRKRGLKKPLSRQERILRRQKREEKEAARKQYSFMERINIRRMKSLLSPSQSGPGRYDAESEVELPERPSCDVFIRSELFIDRNNVPEIYNNPNAPVKLRIELNMTTDKATKMISASDEIVPVPFPFKHTEKRTILAFAATPRNTRNGFGGWC